MNVLVTGATGLVGIGLINLLDIREAHLYYTVRRNSRSNRELCLDLSENDALNTLLHYPVKFDVIIHCAAIIPSNSNSDDFAASMNRKIDDTIIQYCINRDAKLIYFSSVSIYGNEIEGLIHQENEMIIPKSKYAIEKYASEKQIVQNIQNYVIFRMTSPYAPWMKNRNVMKIFIECAIRNNVLIYYGSGNRSQNFIYINDVVSAVKSSIDHNVSGVFNLGGANPISMRQLALTIAEVTYDLYGYKPLVEPAGIEDINEKQRCYYSLEAIRENLEWYPAFDIYQGVKDCMGKWDN
jgi:nucleoside-diphosphate-sugar epimerase